jgi:hypothetical protein
VAEKQTWPEVSGSAQILSVAGEVICFFGLGLPALLMEGVMTGFLMSQPWPTRRSNKSSNKSS